MTILYFWASLVARLVKESACNAGDLGLIPGLGRSPGKGKATHSSILVWRIVAESWTQLSNCHFTYTLQKCQDYGRHLNGRTIPH